MRTFGKVALTVAALVLVAGPALAQRQPGGGGRRPAGGGGFGGPGMLLQNAGVQKELGLTEDQVTKVKDALAKVNDKHKDDLAKLRDLSREERTTKGAEIRKAISADTDKALADVLKPDQAKRLKQIQLQMRGAQAFADPEVAEALKLTESQKKDIKTIQEDATKQMRAMFEGGRPGADAREKMTKLRKETNDKIMDVLKADQKKKYEQLTGKPFQVQFDRRPGGAGGGGERRPGGRRPGGDRPNPTPEKKDI